MKNLIYILLIGMISCKKETPQASQPVTTSSCIGSVWTYSVTLGTTVPSGAISIVYTDGYGGSITDTTITGTWSKVTTMQSTSYYPYLGMTTGPGFWNHYPSGLQTTVTLQIYKDGVLMTPYFDGVPNTGPGPDNFCMGITGGCPVNTYGTVYRRSHCQ